jgi:hypothetical protein
MRDDYLSGVLATEKKNLSTSEIAKRDEFNRQHPPNKGLVVADDLRKMELPARPWRNNRGHCFDLADYEVLGAHISELMPGRQSVRHRHTTEAWPTRSARALYTVGTEKASAGVGQPGAGAVVTDQVAGHQVAAAAQGA